jgi:hypothetical protein
MMIFFYKCSVCNCYCKSIWLEIDVSEECKLALLDLLCINNSDDLKQKPLVQEEYYLRGLKRDVDSRGRAIFVSTWK